MTIRRVLSLVLVVSLALLTACSYNYYHFEDFQASPKHTYPVVERGLLVEPLALESLGGREGDAEELREVADYVGRAVAAYLVETGLFNVAHVAVDAPEDFNPEYRLGGSIDSLLLEGRIDGVWVVLAVAGMAAAAVGEIACLWEIGSQALAGGCNSLFSTIPAWAWWSFGGGAAGLTGGILGGIATSRTRCEAALTLSLSRGGEVLHRGAYSGSYEEGGELSPSFVTQQTLNLLLNDFAAETADELRELDADKQD
ncbi:MAG: hypothetical protein GF403_01535 [Candidatus Coatesbacteria bacterium]|nr:hypothetical protein [Candidatus Coatesbacteria bacterium]